MAEQPKTLQTLLAEKTGKSAEEVQNNLQELKQRIEDTAEDGETYTIEGFGAFTGEAGSLHFEPSDRLETELNQKYAGMQPVELVEAFKETGAGVPLEPVEQESPKQERESLSEPAAGDDDVETDAEEPQDTTPEEKEEHPSPEEIDKAGSDEEEHADLDRSYKRSLPNRRKNEKGAWIAAAAIFIIVILVVGWLFFGRQLSPGQGNSPIKTTQPVNTAKAGDLPVAEETHPVKIQNLQPSETNETSHKKAALNTSSSVAYGLHGKVNKQLEDAYTIVIHSFHLKSTVQGIAKNLRKEGYRAVIFSSKIAGDIHWRVGLGQFKTTEAAQKAVKKLPERYQKAHFIHRIN